MSSHPEQKEELKNEEEEEDEDDDELFSSLIRTNSDARSSIRYSYGSPSMHKQRRRNKDGDGGPPIPNSLRYLTNFSSLLSAFLFTGIIFGWTPLKLLLFREGQYKNLCLNAENDVCNEQVDKYNMIFTCAQFLLSFASLPVGFFLDHCPKPIHYGLAAFFTILGLLLFGISDSNNNDYFVISYSLMGLGGCMTMLGAFPASFLLPNHQAGILAAISCLFDASSIIFAIFDRLNVWNPIVFSRSHLFVIHATLGLVVYSILSYCWTILERRDWSNHLKQQPEDVGDGTKTKNETSTTQQQPHTENGGEENEDPHVVRMRAVGMHDRSMWRQLQTYEFALVLTFASIHMLRCNFYLESIAEILDGIAKRQGGNNDDSLFYANIFSFVLPLGIIFVPLIEATVRHLGVLNTLYITNALGVVFGLLLLLPSLYIQTLNFFIFTCFRAYLYTTLNTFIAISFGVATMGRIIGSTFTTAAVVTLLQYPAAAVAESRHGGDFTIVNIFMLLLCAIPMALSYFYPSRAIQNETTSTSARRSLGEQQPLLAENQNGTV